METEDGLPIPNQTRRIRGARRKQKETIVIVRENNVLLQRTKELELEKQQKKRHFNAHRNPDYNYALVYSLDHNDLQKWEIDHFDVETGQYSIQNWTGQHCVTIYVNPARLHVMDGEQRQRRSNSQEVHKNKTTFLENRLAYYKAQYTKSQKMNEILRENFRRLQKANNTLNLDITRMEARLPHFHADEIMAAQKNLQKMEERQRNRDSNWQRAPGYGNHLIWKGGPGVPG